MVAAAVSRRRTRGSVVALATGIVATVVALLIATAGVHAHEIGTTRVAARFAADGTYIVEVATDATALLGRLEIAAGRPRSRPEQVDVIRASLELEREALLRRIEIAFDGTRSHPAMRIGVTAPTDVNGVPEATLVLQGRTPDGARAFTWSYGLTSASYGLTVSDGAETRAATQWLEGDAMSAPVPLRGPPAASPARLRTAGRYVWLGFTHILPGGLDHVLFVLGLCLLSRRARPMLLQVTTFTVAHSLTLGFGLYGLVSVPSSVVEPLIALSIAGVAIENLLVAEVKGSRILLVFAFGLLHGLGFAGALRDLRLPASEFVPALVGFNAGVELGQLAVIGAAWALVGRRFAARAWYRQRIVLPASLGIACMGLIWAIQRLHLV